RLHEPALTAQVRTIASTERTPIPALVGSPAMDSAAAVRLVGALRAVEQAPELVDIRSTLLLKRFAVVAPQDYDDLIGRAREAAGIKVDRKVNLGGTLIAHKALEEKQIDLYPEYTGTMLLVVLKAEPMTDQKAVYDKVKAEYATKGFVVLNEAPLNNTYNMVVLPETAV